MNLAEADLPAGTVTAFAIEPGTRRRFGLAPVVIGAQTVPATVFTIQLANDLLVLPGRVAGNDDAPIAATVDAEPVSSQTVPFDRVLLALRPRETDTAGRFELWSSSKLRVRLRAGSWTPGAGTQAEHVRRRTIATASATIQPDAPLVTLRVGKAPVVSCQANDDRDHPMAIDRLGLQFGPHVGWGHSGDCVEIRSSSSDAKEPTPADPVRFVWPAGARHVTVTADLHQVGSDSERTAAPSVPVAVELDDIRSPCRLRAAVSGASQ